VGARNVLRSIAGILSGKALGWNHRKAVAVGWHAHRMVEIVDTEAKINEFLPVLDQMMTSGLVTLEKVQVLQYGPKGSLRLHPSTVIPLM
jgi:PII-like signaling protein